MLVNRIEVGPDRLPRTWVRGQIPACEHAATVLGAPSGYSQTARGSSYLKVRNREWPAFRVPMVGSIPTAVPAPLMRARIPVCPVEACSLPRNRPSAFAGAIVRAPTCKANGPALPTAMQADALVRIPDSSGRWASVSIPTPVPGVETGDHPAYGRTSNRL